MLTNYRGKSTHDTEKPEESLINRSFRSTIPDSVKTMPKMTVTYQEQSLEGMDDYYEKKK